MPAISEAGRVALLLAGVLRLKEDFEARPFTDSARPLLLQAAADLLDKSLPAAGLREKLTQVSSAQHLSVLTENQDEIALIPPALWKHSRVAVGDLPRAHYSGLRALERTLRGAAEGAPTAQALISWLDAKNSSALPPKVLAALSEISS